MSARNLSVEDYFYCDLCWTYKDRPNERMATMQLEVQFITDITDDSIDLHFCKSCLKQMLDLVDGYGDGTRQGD